MTKQAYRESERIKPIGTDGINQCREILTTKGYAKVNEVMVDTFSASAITQVYDALNEQNKVKFVLLPVQKAASVAFKLCK